MARKRLISPNFFTSLPVNEVSIEAMVTFAGLWCYADDEGRGEDDLDLIKAAVWPRRKTMTTRKIQRCLIELSDKGLICRYTLNGYALLHHPSWSEHQKPAHPTPSRIGPCPDHEAEAYLAFMNADDHARAKFRDIAGVIRESLTSVSRDAQEVLRAG